MKNDRDYSEIEKAVRSINSIEFEMSLWSKVELVKDSEGKEYLSNCTYVDDVLFPYIKVSGFNEANGCEEQFTIECYCLESGVSRSEYRQEYERTGDSPAFSYPDEVYSLVMTNNANLEVDYYEAKERLEGLRQAEEIKKDTDMYYLLGQSLVGKRVTGSEANDFLFIDSTWTFDDEGIIEKKLSGTDLTELKFESWPPSSIELINEIRSIDRDEAMERITDQTLLGLKLMWKEKFAKAKEEWDKAPKWYAKLVRTDIIMNGVERSITPGDLPFEAGPSIDGFMESIRSEMNEDLRDKGACIVGIWGIID